MATARLKRMKALKLIQSKKYPATRLCPKAVVSAHAQNDLIRQHTITYTFDVKTLTRNFLRKAVSEEKNKCIDCLLEAMASNITSAQLSPLKIMKAVRKLCGKVAK